MAKLTTVVLTRAKSDKLEQCIKSLEKVDTDLIILIGSKDKKTETEKIAKKYIAKVYKHELNGDFSKHRNYVLKYIKTDWLFYIDDDELVTKELAKVLNNLDDKYSAYAIPRKNIIFCKEFKHCGQWPDYVIRIFNKKKLKGYEGKVHEQPKFEGELKHLEAALIHHKHDEIFEMVEKTNNWSIIEAELMYKANHPPMNIPRFCTAMAREFWQRMIIQKAFLDGSEGVIYALYQVFSRFVSYAKLWEMQINNVKKASKNN